MGKPKIDRVKLNRLLRDGKCQKEIAKALHVSEAAVSKAKKELNINVVRNVGLENAHRVVADNLDAAMQLRKINAKANQIIDELSTSSDRGDRQIILKACAEIRGQLHLQLEILRSLHDLEAAAQFQREVLTVIAEVSPNVRRKIIEKLKQKRSLRSSVTIN